MFWVQSVCGLSVDALSVLCGSQGGVEQGNGLDPGTVESLGGEDVFQEDEVETSKHLH